MGTLAVGVHRRVVVTPHGIASLEAAELALQHHVESQPALAQLAAPLTNKLHELIGGPFVSLDTLGIDRTQGLAAWLLFNQVVAVLPLGDRAKLAKVIPAMGTDPDKLGPLTCKSQSGAYVCVSDPPSPTTNEGRGSVKDVLGLKCQGCLCLHIARYPTPQGLAAHRLDATRSNACGAPAR